MRVAASQKLPRDSGESILAARHQDVSQGPLGTHRDWRSQNSVRSLFRNSPLETAFRPFSNVRLMTAGGFKKLAEDSC